MWSVSVMLSQSSHLHIPFPFISNHAIPYMLQGLFFCESFAWWMAIFLCLSLCGKDLMNTRSVAELVCLCIVFYLLHFYLDLQAVTVQFHTCSP